MRLLPLCLLSLSLLWQTGTEHKAPSQKKSNETQNVPRDVPSITVVTQAPANQEQGKANPPWKIPDWTDAFWSNWALVLVGFGTGWIAIATLKDLKKQTEAAKTLAEEAKTSAEFARKTVVAAYRADVLIEAASIVPARPDGQIDGDARLKIKFVNFGRMRATDVQFRVEMHIPGAQLAKGKVELPVMALGPGQDQTIFFQSFREFLTEPIFLRIMRGDIELRFDASAAYRDAFGFYVTMDIGVFDCRAKCFTIVQKIAG